MKYITGAYNSPDSLISVLRDQLVVAGWVVDKFGLVSDSVFGYQLLVHKGDTYFSLRSYNLFDPDSSASPGTATAFRGVSIRGNTGFSESADWKSQPGAVTALAREVLNCGASGKYHFMYSDSIVHVVCEYDTDKYSHLCFGKLDTYSENTGGQFYTASNIRNSATYNLPFQPVSTGTFHCRVSHSDNTAWLSSVDDVPTSVNSYNGKVPTYVQGDGGTYAGAYGTRARSVSDQTGLSSLMPVSVYTLYRSKLCPFGDVTDLSMVSMRLLTPGKQYSVGSSKFIAFPIGAKASPFVYNDAGKGMGVAIKLDE